ncbi:MAG: hypothetical protein KDC35_03545 [Acidobacteria bacterium]|nr:hypothetical protein [Acidobacteriota bacterium]
MKWLALTLICSTGIQPGDAIWVGHGMAVGYGLPFGQKMTVVKARELIMKEVRVVLDDHRKYYLKADFGDDYAFREDPHGKYDFTDQQWRQIENGTIQIGMTLQVFLCIRPRADERYVTDNPHGPIECWVYRDEPVNLWGATEQNPPTAIYYFQNERLVYAIQ